MDKLISDGTTVETSNHIKDVLRSMIIQHWQSEPHYQHQNFSEHRWQHFKWHVNWFINWQDVDPEAWLLLCKWIADIMNHTLEESLGGKIPRSNFLLFLGALTLCIILASVPSLPWLLRAALYK